MIKQSRQYLESAISKTKTHDQKMRANLLLRAFEYYEASVYTYLSSQKYNKMISDETEALEFIRLTLQGGAMAGKRTKLLDDFENDSVLMHPLSIDEKYLSPLRSDAWGSASLWPVYPWLEKSQKVRSRLEEISHSGWNIFASQAKNILEKYKDEQNQ